MKSVARELGIDVADLDEAFGIVPVNPSAGLYAV